MNISLSESDLTAIIKEAMEHYKNKPFGRAIYIQKPSGVEVQFVDVGVDDIPTYRHVEETYKRRVEQDDLPTFHIPDFGGSSDPFGGFGGGASGGAGASGQW
jgi:hypothetical protein